MNGRHALPAICTSTMALLPKKDNSPVDPVALIQVDDIPRARITDDPRKAILRVQAPAHLLPLPGEKLWVSVASAEPGPALCLSMKQVLELIRCGKLEIPNETLFLERTMHNPSGEGFCVPDARLAVRSNGSWVRI